MAEPPIRSSLLRPNDTFRSDLRGAIDALEAWAAGMREAADITVESANSYWRMRALPFAAGACPFEILFNSDQTFSLSLALEVYEERPIDRFDFFPMLARAISRGRIARIDTRSALTGQLDRIEMRVELEDGWAWIGERRVSRNRSGADAAEERNAHPYLPYMR